MITASRARLLRILADAGEPLASREVARAMWPDSPAWTRRTKMNAMGGTMPMLGGRRAREAVDVGQARTVRLSEWTDGYEITAAGRLALAAYEEAS